ncbi:MAG: cupin domain-containing protein [Amphritea sp.]
MDTLREGILMHKHPILTAASLLLVLSGPVIASGCPEGKEGPNPLTPLTELKGDVAVHTYAKMDLGKEAINAKGWTFRARSIMFAPGSVVQLHSHDKRPETAMMKHGKVTIYETNCTVPYVMGEGDIYQSGAGDAHWAVNHSDEHAIMFVADILSTDTFPGK